MAFLPPRNRPMSRPSASGAPVLAVGRRVFVHCAGDRHGFVALTDENGNVSRTRVPDGLEVEVLAWRPRGTAGTRYRVRSERDGTDGWLHASNLRTEMVPAPEPERAAPSAAPDPDPQAGRRFGQRR